MPIDEKVLDKPVEDTYDLLKLDEIPEEKKEEKEEVEDKEEKEEELEIEEEKEVIEPDEDEIITPPHRNEILKAYPDIFKKFPYLEQAMYREKAFSELFGTMDSAKEILEKSQDYDKFSDDLFKGDSTPIFKSVKESDEKSYSNLINNLMPTLSKVDTSAYHWLIGDVIRRTIISAVNSAKQKGNDSEEGQALLGAAAKIHEFVFGDTNLQAPVKFGKGVTANPEVDEEKTKLSEERAQFIQEKFETTKNDLSGRVDNILKNTIDANIDPKDLMSKYIKKNAVNDAMRMLDDLIHEDARFVQLVDKLWQKAFENNFNQDSLGKIRSAFLSKSKTLLPEVIKKIRSEALQSQGSGRKQNEDKPRNKDVSDRVAEQPKNRSNSNEKRDGRGMRTVDFFNQD